MPFERHLNIWPDLAVEVGDQALEGADLALEHLLPIFRLPLGVQFFAHLSLLFDPSEILEVMYGLAVVVSQLLEPVDLFVSRYFGFWTLAIRLYVFPDKSNCASRAE